MTIQDHYETERRWGENRCPRCGSADLDEEVGCGWIWVADDDLWLCGAACPDCGYERDPEGYLLQDAPYIAPGEPGSHDQIGDYPPPADA